MSHFKLTSESIVNAFGVKLFRIELTIDCKWGKAGDEGGFLEKKSNLSGNAWVYGDAQVYGDARVYGDAWEHTPFQIQGSKHFITECKKGYLQIGCKCYTFAEWKKIFKTVGEEQGYTPTQIKEYGYYIDLAIKLSKI